MVCTGVAFFLPPLFLLCFSRALLVVRYHPCSSVATTGVVRGIRCPGAFVMATALAATAVMFLMRLGPVMICLIPCVLLYRSVWFLPS